jgi:hypothetical protein
MNAGSRMAVTGTADDQLKTVACSGCGDEFSTKFTLKRHVSVHTLNLYALCMNVLQRSCNSGTYGKRCVSNASLGFFWKNVCMRA